MKSTNYTLRVIKKMRKRIGNSQKEKKTFINAFEFKKRNIKKPNT